MRATRVSMLTLLTLTMACEATAVSREDARDVGALAEGDADPTDQAHCADLSGAVRLLHGGHLQANR